MLSRVLSGLKAFAEYVAGVGKRLFGVSKPVPNQQSPESASVAAETLTWLRRAFAADVSKNFAESRSPDGSPMRPITYRSGKPLILTGAMMRAAVGAAGRAELKGREVFAPLSSPVYWKFHEFGTKKIPARPFMGPRIDTVRELADRIGRGVAADVIAGR